MLDSLLTIDEITQNAIMALPNLFRVAAAYLAHLEGMKSNLGQSIDHLTCLILVWVQPLPTAHHCRGGMLWAISTETLWSYEDAENL